MMHANKTNMNDACEGAGHGDERIFGRRACEEDGEAGEVLIDVALVDARLPRSSSIGLRALACAQCAVLTALRSIRGSTRQGAERGSDRKRERAKAEVGASEGGKEGSGSRGSKELAMRPQSRASERSRRSCSAPA
eukprot:6147257-Pleurochrysis_carterae.AAC.1